MSKLSTLQEKAKETVFTDIEAFTRLDGKNEMDMQGINDVLEAVEKLITSTYLAAIEDAIASVPKEEPIWNEEAGNKSPTHATASAQAIGFKRCRTELLNRLEALKRV